MECGTAEVIMGGGTGGNKMPHKRETTGGAGWKKGECGGEESTVKQRVR